jgi:hypothetical protein
MLHQIVRLIGLCVLGSLVAGCGSSSNSGSSSNPIDAVEGHWKQVASGRTGNDSLVWTTGPVESAVNYRLEIASNATTLSVTIEYSDFTRRKELWSIESENRKTGRLKIKKPGSDDWRWTEVFIVDNGNTMYWCTHNFPAARGGFLGDGFHKRVFAREGQASGGQASGGQASEGQGFFGWIGALFGWLFGWLWAIIKFAIGAIIVLAILAVVIGMFSKKG